MRITENHISFRKRAMTHCLRGHEYTPENTCWSKGKRGCKTCAKARYQRFKEEVKFESLKKLYGVSEEHYQNLLQEQNGRCKLCGNPPGRRSLNVDHDHVTGEVRGLLCTTCNAGLGCFYDDSELLVKAVVYLKGSRGNA